MWDKLKMMAGGVAAGVVALLYIVFQRRTAQRDEARAERDTARSAKESLAAANKAADKMQEASSAQIKRNNEARAKRAETPADDRFTGRVDLSRLRRKDED